MDFSNPVNRKMAELGYTSREAAREISRRYREVFAERGAELTVNRFDLVKLGHDQARWLREIFAEFFGIPESEIPRKPRG